MDSGDQLWNDADNYLDVLVPNSWGLNVWVSSSSLFFIFLESDLASFHARWLLGLRATKVKMTEDWRRVSGRTPSKRNCILGVLNFSGIGWKLMPCWPIGHRLLAHADLLVEDYLQWQECLLLPIWNQKQRCKSTLEMWKWTKWQSPWLWARYWHWRDWSIRRCLSCWQSWILNGYKHSDQSRVQPEMVQHTNYPIRNGLRLQRIVLVKQ
mgnify:CR=1 FL=1